MKFAKISLAAVVALGALSTGAFAGDLSEAIKGVDVSGTMRYRFTETSFKSEAGVKDADNSDAAHQWRGILTLKTPMAENFQGVVSTRYDSRSNTGAFDEKSPKLGMTDADTENKNSSLATVREVYGVWAPKNTKTSVMVGKMGLNTPVTDGIDDRGTGVLMLSQDAGAVTLAAAAFDTFYIDQIGEDFRKPLYAAALIGGFGNLSAQAWLFNITDTVDSLFFGELAYKFNDMLSLKTQYAMNNVADGTGELAKAMNIESSPSLWTVQANVDYAPVSLMLGYALSGNDGPFVALDDAGLYTYAGEWGLGNYAAVQNAAPKNGKNRLSALMGTLMVDASKVIKDVSVGTDFVAANYSKNTGIVGAKDYDVDVVEWTPRVVYTATKKLTLSSYYSIMSTETDGVKDDEQRNEFRVQALYSF